ncbi:hypothetical protein N431DRAFT_407256 [Stipitochalara longipes BDJ]|nr:hypothetical protein N431DRAFT_407256 [Stipitochalara longipes BDJ]
MYAKVWDVLDVVTLVACSEFCLQFDWDFEAFVTEQLRESRRRRTGQEYPFTFKQVKGKLTDLARSDLDPTRQTKEYPRYDEIIAKGSACFPRLARELRPQIDLELERFRELYPLPQPQGAQLPDTEGITSNVRDVLLEENSELPDRRLMEVSSTPRKLSNTVSFSHKPSHVPTPKTVVASSKSHNRIEIRKGYSPGNGAWQRSQILDHQHDATGRLEILWEEDVTTLRGQIADLEREKERLLAMLQIFDNAQQQSESSGHDPKVSQLRVYQQDIWTLQQLNIDLESVADFFKLEATESRAFQTEHIDKSMEQIQTELESILGNCDTTNLQVNRALEHGSDLEALLLSCLKLHKTPEHLDSRLKECISQFEVPILVRAVVLAALNDWVFNASFPPFMREGSTSLFLKSIEEIALEHRDWAWLRNLETAAYSRFLERSEFKEGLLPMKSRLLADRLSNATASFITPITSEISRDDKPKAIDSILESLHARYIKLFSAGLKFKAATAVTDNKYEFVLKLPGTLIGEQSQEQIPRSTHTTQERSRIADKERSWFHASLRVYDAGPANWLNPRTDAIIQTDNFVSGISKTNNKCIYHKDIAIKISDIREDRSGLETHRTIGRSGSQLLSALFTVQFNDPDTRPNSYNRIDDALEQKMSRSSQNLTNNPSNREPDQHQAADTSAKQIAAPQRQRDNDNGSQPDLTPVADPYQMDPGVSKTNAGATKSKRGIRRSTIDRPGTAGAFVCSACGTPLSTSDILRRHEKNGTCFDNRDRFWIADSSCRIMSTM